MTRRRRSFTAAQKAEAVRKLKDHVPVYQIAEQMVVQPTMIHNWINTALAQVELAFESPRTAKAESTKHDQQVQHLREKFDAKNEVIAERMEENIRAKMKMGSSNRSLGS